MTSLHTAVVYPKRPTGRARIWLRLAATAVIATGASAGSATAFDASTACTSQSTGSMNRPRQSAAAVTLNDGTVLVVGGRSVPGHASNEASAEVFAPGDGTWRMVGAMGEGRFYHSLTKLADGRVLAAGGNPGFCSTSSAAIYDPATESWTATPPMNLPRAEHAAVLLHDGRVMLVGGQTCSGAPSWTATTDIYDPASNTWTLGPPMASPRNSINEVVVLDDGRVLVAGGYVNAQSLSGVEIFDPSSNSWSSAAPLATPRHGSQMTGISTSLYLLNGGYSTPTVNATGSEIFDAQTGTWSATGGLNLPRYQHTTVRAPGFAPLAIAGWGVNGLPVADIEGYDAAEGDWAILGRLLEARALAAVAPLADGRVLVAGGTDGTANYPPTASAELVLCQGSPVYVSVDSGAILEGNSGQTIANFTVSLSRSTSLTVSVDYATSDGTAAAEADYGATTGTLTFPPGTTTQTVEVLINGDFEVEGDEAFHVALSNPVNATLADEGSAAMRWTQLSVEASQPSARQSATSAYDGQNDRLIAFGGYVGGFGGTRALTDVWVLSGAAVGAPSWRQLIPQGSGPTGEDGRGVYRASTNRFITFGTIFPNLRVIEQPFVLANADGTGGTPAWIPLPHLGRANAAAALDEASNRLIVFGGFEFAGSSDAYSNEVWILENADATGGTPTWTRLSPVGVAPAPRAGAQGAYDPHSNRLIVYGGGGPAGGPGGKFLDLWVLTHANGLGGTPEWIQLLTTSPLGPRYGEKSAYDAQTKRLILHAGLSGINSAGYSDTWVLVNADGTTGTPQWLEAHPSGSPLVGRAQYEIGYSPATDRVIVTQGQWGATFNFLSDLWVLENATGRNTGSAEGVGTILNDDFDRTQPTITASATTAPNAAGWYNDNVVVRFTCADAGSGVPDGACPVDQTLSSEGSAVASSVETVTDAAGNVSAPSNVVVVKIDKTPPTISAVATAAPNAAGWYNNNVIVHFTCTDAGSGIPAGACPQDQILTSEGAAVASSAQTVTDAAGNVSAPSNVVIVRIDKTAPNLSPIVSPNPVFLNGAATVISGAVDALSGLASQTCGTLVTSAVGPKSVSCTATDNAGNTVTGAAGYSVIYGFGGFLQPINDTAHQTCSGCPISIFKGGSTVPVKIRLVDAAGNPVQTSSAPLWITPVRGGSTDAPVDEGEYTDLPTTGVTYQLTDGHYQYNWKTKGLAVGFYWRIGVLLDDGQTYFVYIGLK